MSCVQLRMNIVKDTEVVINGHVYDLKKFSEMHPGGKCALNIFGGKDATIHYHMLHQHLVAKHRFLDECKIRKFDEDQNHFIVDSEQFKELKRQIKATVPYTFATAEWYIKAFIIMSLEISLEVCNILYGFTYLKSLCLGILMALIGLCVQHDANHGAISPNGWVNFAWGLTQDWIGGSSLLWKHHHVLLHHAYTNLEGLDPDTTTDIIRVHVATLKKKVHKFQQFYIWFLLPLLPIKWHFNELCDLINMHHMGFPISNMARKEAYLGIFMRFLFYIRFYVIPLYLHPSIHTLLCIFYSLAIGGFYLGVNFIISHNFVNVENVVNTERDWAFTQLLTSSSVGGRLLGFFHGGLNYQIEHHLFPRICHVHYHKMQPIIQNWAKKHNLTYKKFDTLYDNILSCYQYLKVMGQNIKND